MHCVTLIVTSNMYLYASSMNTAFTPLRVISEYSMCLCGSIPYDRLLGYD